MNRLIETHRENRACSARRISSDKRARMHGRTDSPILNGSRVISTQNWLAVNLFSHVLRVIRG
jgi:hypothetical protein